MIKIDIPEDSLSLGSRGDYIDKTVVQRGHAVTFNVKRPRTLYGYLLERGLSKELWAEMRLSKEYSEECARVEMELHDDLIANALVGNYDSNLVSKLLGIGQSEVIVQPAININLQLDGKDLPKRLEVG